MFNNLFIHGSLLLFILLILPSIAEDNECGADYVSNRSEAITAYENFWNRLKNEHSLVSQASLILNKSSTQDSSPYVYAAYMSFLFDLVHSGAYYDNSPKELSNSPYLYTANLEKLSKSLQKDHKTYQIKFFTENAPLSSFTDLSPAPHLRHNDSPFKKLGYDETKFNFFSILKESLTPKKLKDIGYLDDFFSINLTNPQALELIDKNSENNFPTPFNIMTHLNIMLAENHPFISKWETASLDGRIEAYLRSINLNPIEKKQLKKLMSHEKMDTSQVDLSKIIANTTPNLVNAWEDSCLKIAPKNSSELEMQKNTCFRAIKKSMESVLSPFITEGVFGEPTILAGTSKNFKSICNSDKEEKTTNEKYSPQCLLTTNGSREKLHVLSSLINHRSQKIHQAYENFLNNELMNLVTIRSYYKLDKIKPSKKIEVSNDKEDDLVEYVSSFDIENKKDGVDFLSPLFNPGAIYYLGQNDLLKRSYTDADYIKKHQDVSYFREFVDPANSHPRINFIGYKLQKPFNKPLRLCIVPALSKLDTKISILKYNPAYYFKQCFDDILSNMPVGTPKEAIKTIFNERKNRTLILSASNIINLFIQLNFINKVFFPDGNGIIEYVHFTNERLPSCNQPAGNVYVDLSKNTRDTGFLKIIRIDHFFNLLEWAGFNITKLPIKAVKLNYWFNSVELENLINTLSNNKFIGPAPLPDTLISYLNNPETINMDSSIELAIEKLNGSKTSNKSKEASPIKETLERTASVGVQGAFKKCPGGAAPINNNIRMVMDGNACSIFVNDLSRKIKFAVTVSNFNKTFSFLRGTMALGTSIYHPSLKNIFDQNHFDPKASKNILNCHSFCGSTSCEDQKSVLSSNSFFKSIIPDNLLAYYCNSRPVMTPADYLVFFRLDFQPLRENNGQWYYE